MRKTAGTVGAALVGGARLKVCITALVKRLAIKLAANLAIKTGMKWAAAACSSTGPAAATRGVFGAAITRVATDIVMIKLDECVTCDDFERDLRDLIDDHKKETHRAMEGVLASKILAVESEPKIVIREVSLSELKDADRLMTCEAEASILGRYDGIRGNLQARSSANIASFQGDFSAQETSHLSAASIGTMKATITDLPPERHSV